MRRTTLHRIPITRARINLGEVARRAHVQKEYFILEKDGIPVIGIMDAEELEDYLEARDPRVQEIIRDGNAAYRSGKRKSAEAFIAELEHRDVDKRRKRQP